LHFFPNRYIDRSRFYTINQLPQNNAEVQIKGEIIQIKTIPQKRGKRLVAVFSDGHSQMELVWFRGHKWIQEQLKLNTPYVAFGRLSWFGSKANMPHPELTLEAEFEASKIGALHPVYPSTEKLTNKGVTQRIMKQMMVNLFFAKRSHYKCSLP